MNLYSLKMRASRRGEHVSGAEKIIEQKDIKSYADSLIMRSLHHAKGQADFINIKIASVDETDILYLDALSVKKIDVRDAAEGRLEIIRFLQRLGMTQPERIMELFEETYSMRGAMLLDVHSLERLEPDKARGIRATFMDMERQTGKQAKPEDTKNHFMEALVLATKVANAPGIIGEICISDDPDYVTGYVASKQEGYVRITRVKEAGSPLGGRIFLYDGSRDDIRKTIDFLERQHVLVRNTGDFQVTGERVNEHKLDFIDRELTHLQKQNLYRTVRDIETMQTSHVLYQGKDMLMLASNSYLDIISSREVRNYASLILQEYGAGSGGSRLTTGNTVIHRELERALARFKGTEDAIVFNTGYVANLATVSSLAGRGNVIFSDALNHASLIDGCRLSGAKIVVYAHNDMEDLEAKIRENMPCSGLIVSDAVFSMDGDILKLPRFVELGNQYNLITMIDEAHSTGVIGKSGRGISEYFNYSCEKPDIIMGTLSKAIGSEGGFVCAAQKIVSYLMNKARGYIFSTSLSPVTMAASYKALQIIEEHPIIVQRLQENVHIFCECLNRFGIEAESETAIIPILIGDEKKAVLCQERLMEQGYYISAIRYPTVKRGEARLRVALMASHTEEELNGAARAIAEAVSYVRGKSI